ncbi:hypothetical protein HPB48_010656 [Haemaphysalis longicornis]|uniref:Tyrosine-protein phosphatase domain-containing protein n=1 Tax=Haemaphysalis longicornis TaxID=44386 RepID=A0A9J6FW85_HAELO|nr:hypothetical protein HPB48_010656 [Haemaphysalis longicornis]
MLSQAEAEGEVNLVAHLHAMRQNRVDLVESPEQYIFAYKVLVEMLCSKKHQLSIGDFVRLYPKLKTKLPATGKSAIDLEFEVVGIVHRILSATEAADGTYYETLA